MIIHKILNNNVVITLDDDKREQIVMGKGIAFKKRIGDWVPDESIDQVFYLANQETSLKFQELLGNIPLERVKCLIGFLKALYGYVRDLYHVKWDWRCNFLLYASYFRLYSS